MQTYTKQYKFNGTALVAYDGKILLDKGYGFRNTDNKTPNDPGSVFQIGSITKQFTTTVILKLQEEKKLKVSDKLSKYFPDYPKGDSITIEHLMTHTSGIYSYTSDPAFMENEVSKPADRQKMMDFLKISRSIFPREQNGIIPIPHICCLDISSKMYQRCLMNRQSENIYSNH